MSAYGFTVFCDDIRYEIGGKISFMGIYGGELVVFGEYPLTINKLMLAVYVMDIPEHHGDEIDIAVFMPGNVGSDPDYMSKYTLVADEPSEDSEKFGISRRAVASDLIQIGPITVTERGYIRVRAYHKGQEIKSGALEIRVQNEDEEG